MKKPFKYSIFCNKSGRLITETNAAPLLRHLQTWEVTSIHGTTELMQTKTVYVDTRYQAKLRLYNYFTFTKKGLKIPKYKPFAGTEIGKSTPILNF